MKNFIKKLSIVALLLIGLLLQLSCKKEPRSSQFTNEFIFDGVHYPIDMAAGDDINYRLFPNALPDAFPGVDGYQFEITTTRLGAATGMLKVNFSILENYFKKSVTLKESGREMVWKIVFEAELSHLDYFYYEGQSDNIGDIKSGTAFVKMLPGEVVELNLSLRFADTKTLKVSYKGQIRAIAALD
ncbi:MAG: hypothetical protein WC960_05915 [Bacteroidales bacterium]